MERYTSVFEPEDYDMEDDFYDDPAIDIDYDDESGYYYFYDDEIEETVYYDPITDEYFTYDYEDYDFDGDEYFESVGLTERFVVEKPTDIDRAVFDIKKGKQKVKGKVQTGYFITKRKASKQKKLTKRSKASYKQAAKKAQRTKKADPMAQKKAIKKAKATRKLNKK